MGYPPIKIPIIMDHLQYFFSAHFDCISVFIVNPLWIHDIIGPCLPPNASHLPQYNNTVIAMERTVHAVMWLPLSMGKGHVLLHFYFSIPTLFVPLRLSRVRWKWEILCLEQESNPSLWHTGPVCYHYSTQAPWRLYYTHAHLSMWLIASEVSADY